MTGWVRLQELKVTESDSILPNFSLLFWSPPFGVGTLSSREAVLPLLYCVKEDGPPWRMTAHGMSRKCAKRPRSGSSNAGRTGAEILAPKYRGEALDRAKRLEPIIREMQNEGYSMRRMATELIQAEGENASRW